MATTVNPAARTGGDEVWSIERRGIDLIPDAERHGKPTVLFWVWAATNTIITYVIFGSIMAALGLSNVTVRHAASIDGEPSAAPYDVIVLNGATEIAPQRLFDQLGEGGRLVGVFATTNPSRAMLVCRAHGDFGHRTLFDAAAPVLPGLERLAEFVF